METLARQFKAFTRARKIKTVPELLRLVLLFAGLDQSERQVAANVVLAQPEIGGLTDEAVRQRLAACLPWLAALLPTLIKRERLPALPSGLRLSALDASTIRAPGEKGVTWRIHLALDLLNWRMRGVRLTEVKTGETLLNFDFAQGAVVLTDRGYCHRAGLAHLIAPGAAPVGRCQPQQFPLETRAGESLDVAAALAECAPGETRTLAVQFTFAHKTYPVYLQAYRLPEEAAAASAAAALAGGEKRRLHAARDQLVAG